MTNRVLIFLKIITRWNRERHEGDLPCAGNKTRDPSWVKDQHLCTHYPRSTATSSRLRFDLEGTRYHKLLHLRKRPRYRTEQATQDITRHAIDYHLTHL
jgi:hypothetical protein